MNFNCTPNCGLCCEHVPNHPDIQSLDGVCVLLDPVTRQCIDYDNRPDICNVCTTYKDYAHKWTEEEYLNANYEACTVLKSKYLFIIGETA